VALSGPTEPPATASRVRDPVRDPAPLQTRNGAGSESADAGLLRRLAPLAAVFDGSPEPVAVVDREGRVRYANPPCGALFGNPPEALVGRPVADCAAHLVGARGLPCAADVEAGAVLRGHFELHPEGAEPRWVSWSASPLRDDAGVAVGVVVFLRDDTDRCRDEQRWSRRHDELEQTIRAVAHDLRSPLVSVLGFSRLLRDDFGGLLGERGTHYLERITEAGRTMETLIRELLDFARIGHCEQRVLVDPREVLEQLQGELKPRLDAADAALQLPVEPPMVLCDRTRLYQLFSNLIGNALDHMGPCEQPTIAIEVREDERSHVLVVRDNGRGIDPAQHRRIFEMFHSVAREGGRRGTGIGLAIVKKIAELHGGRVWVESAPGAGAAFHVTLPRP
jgi:PAS domain S-box-containing protein